MKERFTLQNDEAAPESGAAFILDNKSGLKARIVAFRTLRDLDLYQPSGETIRVRKLPVLLEIADSPTGDWIIPRILKRMENWYYHTQINPPPAGTPSASGSAD